MKEPEKIDLCQILHNPNGKIDFYDKNLSSYIFLKTNLSCINFSEKLIYSIFDIDIAKDLATIYLSFLEQKENEKYLSLKTEKGFPLEVILESICKDLNDDFSKYYEVLFVLEARLQAQYKEKYRNTDIKNPLDQVLKSPFLNNFFDGLDFSYEERVFFVTNMLNYKWKWVYPEKAPDEHNIKTFSRLVNKNTTFTPHYIRHLNEKLIHIGLFSDFWETADYVDAYFQNKQQTFSKINIKSDFEMDSVDYKDVLTLNKTELEVFYKLLSKSFKNKESSYELLTGSNNYRLKNFASYYFSKKGLTLQSLYANDFSENPKELAFYVYALARECVLENSILSLDSKFLEILTKKEETENRIILFPSRQNNAKINFDILSNTKTPLILFSDKNERETQNLMENLESKKINVYFTCKLKLPKENKYTYCAERFFANNKQIPLSILGSIVKECKKYKINPEDWPKITKIFSNGEELSINDVKLLIQNNFNIKEPQKKKQNSHYSFEALNTEPSISDIVAALKNVKKHELTGGEKIGCAIKNSGASGTGKTAFAKAVAEKLNLPIKIVQSSDIFSPYSGETEQNIKKVFDEARETNSILLFDEADSFLHTRGDTLNRHNDFKVNEFLTQMENFDGILFCNTNLPENFDKATDRRFNFHVKFNSLTRHGIDILCNSYFKDYSLSNNQKDEIYNSGEITPGDFGNLHKKLVFISKEKINAEFICHELISLGKQKKRSFENQNKIGFEF